jgi:excinuclease ABC subunit B
VHNITPKNIEKAIKEELLKAKERKDKVSTLLPEVEILYKKLEGDVLGVIEELERLMREAADNLDYERAITLRNELFRIKRESKNLPLNLIMQQKRKRRRRRH